MKLRMIQGLRALLALGCGVTILVAPGCWKPKQPVAPDFFPLKYDASPFSWKAPSLSSARDWRYVPEQGTENPHLEDGVLITVTPIGEGSRGDMQSSNELMVTCSGAQGSTFRLPAFGSVLRVEISNQTGHILRMEKSVLDLEDASGAELPIENVPDWLPRTKAMIRVRYDKQRAELEKAAADARARLVPALRQAGTDQLWWDNYVAQVELYNDHNPPSKHEDVETGSSPIPEIERLQHTVAQLESEIASETHKIYSAEQACFNAAKKAAGDRLRLLTKRTFPLEVILPDKTLDAFLPLAVDPRGMPEKLRIRIYDLVTKTDPAGNPIKRTHFEFVLRKETVE